MKTKAVGLAIVFTITFFLSACSGDVNGVPQPRSAPNDSVEAGQQLIASYGCGSCHSIPGVAGANSMVAPPLKCFYQRSYIAGRLANNRENLIKWIQNPQQIEPGTAMPDLGVSQDEASEIADYLYNPPAFWGWVPSNVFERKCSG